MLHKRTPYLIAAAALLAGGAAGAGSYAAFGTDGSTTVVREAVASGSPTAATKTMSVNGVYKSAYQGVVEITVTTSGSSQNSPFPFGGSEKSQAQGSGFVYDSAGHVITNDHVI